MTKVQANGRVRNKEGNGPAATEGPRGAGDPVATERRGARRREGIGGGRAVVPLGPECGR